MAEPFFRPTLFGFLRELRENNDRDWFQKNKRRFEEDVKEPLQAFVAAMASPLEKISSHLVADPRPIGGSIFRIYRDVRFSKDKSPYKTNAAARFFHEKRGRDVHAPGYYLHLEPGGVFAGAGVWHPGAPALRAVRDAIVECPDDWREAVSGRTFRRHCRFGGESLKRPPRGYDGDHPLIEDLKRKEYVVFEEFEEADALAPDFQKRFLAFCRAATPLMAFLCSALDLEW